MKKQFVLIICMLGSLSIHSQLIDNNLISSFDQGSRHYVFKEGLKITPDALLNPSKRYMKTHPSTGFTLLKVTQDEIGQTHYTYQQNINNVPVDGKVLKIHTNSDDQILSVNGNFDYINLMNTRPQINSDNAIQHALRNFPGVKFAWEDAKMESNIKLEKKNSFATHYPQPELVIATNEKGEYKLGYKMIITTAEPVNKYKVVVDANDGSTLQQLSMIRICGHNHTQDDKLDKRIPPPCTGSCHTGTANTWYYSSQYINTEEFMPFLNCKYRLKESCTSTTIYTMDYNSGSPEDITDETNNWTYVATKNGVTAHWCAEMTHDYYRFNQGRNSYNNSSAQINVFVNDDTYGSANAYWNGSELHIGSVAHTLDVIGHEFTHGVNDYEANLIYSYESGALDESFADIFGTMVEFYAKSTHSGAGSANYTIGEDFGTFRDMSNPNAYGDPDTYGGTNWYTGSGDNGGVHTNSGVQNFWFYLLSEGGSGTNDLSNNYCVIGIGRTKAANIAYRNLTTYLGTTSDYDDARYYSIQSAIDLYGANSFEVAQVTHAWYAVGVGADYSSYILVSGHTATGVETYEYNDAIRVQTFTANSGSDVVFKSPIEIDFLPDVVVNSGSLFHAYIAPGCHDGVRMLHYDGSTAEHQYHQNDMNISYNTEELNSLEDEMSEGSVNLYPNPNNGSFEVAFRLTSGNDILPAYISIVDMFGKEVYKTYPVGDIVRFDLSTFRKGAYSMIAQYGDRSVVKRFIIQ